MSIINPIPSKTFADTILNRVITDDTLKMVDDLNLIILFAAMILGVSFFFWAGFQARRGEPVLIPNMLWKSRRFTSMCINVFLIWGAFNAFEQISNFVFQDVQGLSALVAAFQFLPVSISGFITSIITGLLLHRVRADYVMYITIALSTFSPLLMAILDPADSYWKVAFPAVFLNSIGADSLFTISNLVIGAMFPMEMQGLAGGVFNTVSQIGKSVGMAVVALIGNTITQHSSYDDKGSPEALMVGYRVCFWVLFACYVASIIVTIFGFRQIGIIGHAKWKIVSV
jgi:nitrate/nitrite transporter NarK